MHPTCTSQTQHMAKASTGQESAVTRCKFASSSEARGNAHSPCVTPNTLMSVTFIAPQAFISQFQVSPNVHFTNTITAQPRTHSYIPKHRFRSECINCQTVWSQNIFRTMSQIVPFPIYFSLIWSIYSNVSTYSAFVTARVPGIFDASSS